MKSISREISVEGKHFKVYTTSTTLYVERTDYKSVLIKGFWREEVDPCDIWDDVENPIKVIREIFNEVLGIIAESKTNYFHFSASGKSRVQLYNRLSKIIANKLHFKVNINDYENRAYYTFYREHK